MTNRAMQSSGPPTETPLTFLPEGRPYLLESSRTKDLVYLSWGRRCYYDAPTPVTAHEGWVCTLILKGSPVLLHPPGAPREIPRHTMVVVGPETISGWADRKGRTCEQLTWVWRQPVLRAFHPNARQGLLVIPLGSAVLERLKDLHRQCRQEIAASDSLTTRALKTLHETLQIELERSLGGAAQTVTGDRFQFALSWLARHGQEPKPVARLSEYLQISLSSLDRLFRKHTGEAAAPWLHRRKMNHAARLLREGGLSKKQIAYELGYRHPCDFSRAWSRWLAKGEGVAGRNEDEHTVGLCGLGRVK